MTSKLRHRDYGKPGIAESLRRHARLLRADKITPDQFPDVMDEAADTIARQEAEIETLCAAIRGTWVDEIIDRLREAKAA